MGCVLLLAGSVRAADPPVGGGSGTLSTQSALDAALATQEALLDRVDAGPPSDLEPVLGMGIHEGADPRIARPAPADRDLPAVIFDEEVATIPAGAWGNRSKQKLLKRALDADGDGEPELVRYIDPQTGWMVRQESDRNYDGVTDTWKDYQDGHAISRVMDSNDDGNPDVFERYQPGGLMTSAEIDHDDDGVHDAFYRYEGESLVEEKHDENNDEKVDLRILYESRMRVRAEEDGDKDGRMDTWTTYGSEGGREQVVRIERDKKGRGFADTFEIFETVDGKAVLVRREEDLDGDGEIDMKSIYKDGRLIRREIANPDLVPMAGG